jgi:disulfide oxidoreductase YuzD
MAKDKAAQTQTKDSNVEEIHWLAEVAEHDYPAAQSYLNLLFGPERVDRFLADFRAAPVGRVKAKDIFRASQLALLGENNSHVEKDWKRIRQGESLSPLLLVRDEAHGKVVIADGYHRLCAVYLFDEDAWIPCKIV